MRLLIPMGIVKFNRFTRVQTEKDNPWGLDSVLLFFTCAYMSTFDETCNDSLFTYKDEVYLFLLFAKPIIFMECYT